MEEKQGPEALRATAHHLHDALASDERLVGACRPHHDAGESGARTADSRLESDPPGIEREVVVDGGRRLCLRPIQPDDAEALVDMGLRSTPEDLRLRFFSPIRPRVGPLTSLLTEFDRDRHIAVAAYNADAGDDDHSMLGVVRLILAPEKLEGEFAIMVRSDQAGHGLGHCLMQQMLGWARDRGLTRVRGEILAENKRMLRLAREFGAVTQPKTRDFHTIEVAIDIDV